MLNVSDKEKIWTWNRELAAIEKICVHELIEKTAEANADATAVHAWDGLLTYRQLHRYSSRLAVWLKRAGLGRGVIVPLLFEKSLYSTVALLGVMKAGAAFVQLDVTLPEARIIEMVAQTDAPLILTSPSNIGLAGRLGPDFAVVSKDAPTLQSLPSSSSGRWDTSPSDRLYIIFTSGSTGRPKGAMISHANFASMAKTHSDFAGISSDTRVFDFCSYAFDASIYFHLLTLIAGGCVCVPSEVDRLETPEATMTAMKATTMLATPSVARMLDPLKTPTLKVLMMAGESLNLSIMRKWTKHIPVLNLFGPCECTAVCTGVRYEKENGETKISIGKAVGCATWVVNAENSDELVPIGAIGELVIEGPIVGQGYLKDSSKTAEAFVDAPPWLRDTNDGVFGRGGRVYLTGDLVRYDLDGSLTFLGRKDTKRKIRGQQVELGEIEDFATQILGDDVDVVAEMCTAADAPETNQLVIFIRVHPENPATNGNYRTHQTCRTVQNLIIPADDEIRHMSTVLKQTASRKLPAYMAPSVVFKLSQVPKVLPSMKVDRQLLRKAVGALSRAQMAEYETEIPGNRLRPVTDTERLLQSIWADTLHMQAESIGLTHNFFRLGGDSVSAIQLISAARSSGLVIRMADILRYPILSDMAMITERMSSENSGEDYITPFALLKGIEVETAIREAAHCCNISEDSIEDIYPCTPLQEGMMAISMKSRGSQVACTVFELPVDVDLPRLRASWVETARANSIMRTRIVQVEPVGVLQVVLRDDLVIDTAESPELYLSRSSHEYMGPGSRLTYLACAGENSTGPKYIVRKMHHAVCDGWQDRIILEQVERAYRGERLPKEIPFKAFVRYISDQEHETAARYWQKELAGAPPATFPAKLSATYTPWVTESREYYVSLPINRDASEYTLSTSIRLAWALVLGAYLQSDDVVLGVTISGRSAPVGGIEKMTGPAVATVPLRIKLNYRESVRKALHNLHEQCRAMIPFEQTGLQYIKRLVPEIAEACDFQTLLVVQPSEQPHDFAIQEERYDRSDAGLPFGCYGLVLECTMLRDREAIKVTAHVDTNLLHLDQLETLTDQFGHVLRQIAIRPNCLIGDIEKVSPEDIEQLSRWNGKIPKAGNRTLHDLVEQQCLSQPTAQAVCSSDGGLSYAELDDVSSRLAQHLRDIGIKQGMVVPLFVGHSVLSAVAILGVLKCGGACASLDAAQSPRRLNEIIRKVDAKIALVTSSQTHITSVIEVQFITLTRSWLYQLSRARDFSSSRDTNSTAFLVTTSGSTGIPKIIMMEHKSLASSILALIPLYGLANDCRTLQFSSSVFDLFIYEHLATLIVGGCICIPSELEKMNSVSQFARESRVNFALLTPTTLRAIGSSGMIPSLRLLFVGGEALPSDVVEAWISSVTIVNGYGPAECCICSGHFLDKSDYHPLATIGRPCGALFWIVEENDYTKLAPIGVIGELLIEGPVLARGYFKDTFQTAASFIDAPDWLMKLRPGAQGRLFRSGDLVRYNPDGTLVYVARKDTQVKLRGCRIELGEVEHHLFSHFNGVPVAAEVLRSKDQENARLVAFVSMADALLGTDGTNEGIIIPADLLVIRSKPVLQNLAKVLPAYMVPSILIPVRYMPRTIAGKTDRKLLRQAAEALSIKQLAAYAYYYHRETIQPRTDKERLMRELWAEVLRIPPETIGTSSNFFHLGGDSVTAMRLVISKPFQIEVDSIVDVLPATLHQSFEIQNTCPYMTFTFDNNVDVDHVLQSWKKVVQQHDILRTVFIPYQNSHLQIILKSLGHDVEYRTTQEDKSEDVLEKDCATGPPVPGKSPLKIIIVRTKGGVCLTLRISHAQYDGWSFGELLEDWGRAFAGLPLPDRTQFPEFIYITTRVGQDGGYKYWQNLLSAAHPTCFHDPCVNASPDIPIKRIQTTRTIDSIVIPRESTPATLVKAAWTLTLAKRLSSMDIVMFQLTSARRNRRDATQDTVGPCLALLPTRVTIQPHWRARDLCQFIQDQDVESMAFDNIGLPNLIEKCTDWPSDVRLGSIIDHQSDECETSLTLNGSHYKPRGYMQAYIPTDVEVDTTLVGDTLKIEINSPSNVLGETESIEVAKDFCLAVEHLSRLDVPSLDFVKL
ncbi:MAG: hypothetical protein Q9217_005842 [Psora testacea]